MVLPSLVQEAIDEAKNVKILKEGERSREVREWTEDYGVKYPLLAKSARRIVIPQDGWHDGLEERLFEVEKGIEGIKDRPASTSESNREKRLLDIQAFEEEREELMEARGDRSKWEYIQIYRCIHGYKYMTGWQYFYFQFGWIQGLKNGAQRNLQPNYRACDSWVARMFDRAMKLKIGICLVKRRRWGWSWMLVYYCLWKILFHDGNVFFVTKDEDDRDKFFERIDFAYKMIPSFLRKPTGRDAMEHKQYLPNEKIAAVRGIKLSEIPMAVLRTGSPQKEENVEGGTCTDFIIDEGGKMPNLRNILKVGIPMLNGDDGLTREGILMVGGTVGDMDRSGNVMKTVYYGCQAYQMAPAFVKGAMGTTMDEYGNDLEKEALKKINLQHQLYLDGGLIEEARNHKQMFPENLKDAFLARSADKLWPIVNINDNEATSEAFKHNVKYGLFRRDPTTKKVEFVRQEPNPANDKRREDHIGHGQWHIYEDPVVELRNYFDPYVAGCDPVELSRDVWNERDAKSRMMDSDIAACVYKRACEVGGMGDWPVAWYYGRPRDVDVAYEQIYLGCEYYHRAKLNIERNVGKLIWKYGRSHANGKYQDLIAYGSGVALGWEQNEKNWGFQMNERAWSQLIPMGRDYWEKYFDRPHPQRFIDESRDIKERNTDVGVAFLASLMLAREYDTRNMNGRPMKSNSDRKLNTSLWVEENGILVPAQGNNLTKISRGKSASRMLWEEINKPI